MRRNSRLYFVFSPLAVPLRHRWRAESRRVPPAAGEDLPHEDPVQEVLRAQGGVRGHPRKDGGHPSQEAPGVLRSHGMSYFHLTK